MNNNKFSHAETAIIGALLSNKDIFDDVVCELMENDFVDQFLSKIFRAIKEMKNINQNAAIDILTVHDYMKSDKFLDQNNLFVQLGEVSQSPFAPSNLKYYIEIVKKESNKRKTALLLCETNEKLKNGDEDYLIHLQRGITNIENNSPFLVTPYAELLTETMNKLDEDSKNGVSISGLQTGFVDIDFYTNGLQNGDLIILAARPSVGKSMLMLNIADHIGCTNQLPIVIFSLEMPGAQLCKRSLVKASRVEGNAIFKNKITENDWELIAGGVKKLSNSKVFINDRSRMNVYQMRSFCRKVRNEHGLKAVFIDYIGLMDGEGENETLRLGNISRDLKALAKDFDVPVFVLCQLNRRIESEKRAPMLSDIRQSGNIEQDADLVMFLSRDKETDNVVNLHIEKHRNGQTGMIKLTLNANYFEFNNFSGFRDW